jgi:hypothetical protein
VAKYNVKITREHGSNTKEVRFEPLEGAPRLRSIYCRLDEMEDIREGEQEVSAEEHQQMFDEAQALRETEQAAAMAESMSTLGVAEEGSDGVAAPGTAAPPKRSTLLTPSETSRKPTPAPTSEAAKEATETTSGAS